MDDIDFATVPIAELAAHVVGIHALQVRVILAAYARRDEFDAVARPMIDKAYLGVLKMSAELSKGTDQENYANEILAQAEMVLAMQQASDKGAFVLTDVFHE
jgi:hypothetical protein